ncbi:xanthine dehydrogenase family protein subunit M [soil metagenome]
MKASAVAYRRATTLDEALAILDGAGGAARLLAGGQSVVASLNLRLAEAVDLVDINHVAELAGIEDRGDHLRLGALTRHRMLETSPLVAEAAPMLAAAAPLIAHPPIRNRGTLGGSLAYADPAAELPACMLALEARIVARSTRGSRHIPAEGFFQGLFQTALAEDELIEAVEVPRRGGAERQVVLELTRRSGDYAIVGIALRADAQGPRLARSRVVFFGVGEAPVLAPGAMAALDEGDLGAAEAALDGDLDPPSDLHGSSAFRRHLARVLLRRAAGSLAARPDAEAA